jgi:hypothetical protein
MSAVAVEQCRVYYDAPVCIQINPVSANGRKVQYLYTEITEICRKLRMAGWDTHAIVVKREVYPSGFLAMYEMRKPAKWGVVTQLNHTAPTDRPYVPLKVTWFMDGTVSDHWPEDLFMVMESMSQHELEQQFKAELNSDPPV